MTEIAVKKQIAKQILALRQATARATISREAANQYLISAGIIEETKSDQLNKKKK